MFTLGDNNKVRTYYETNISVCSNLETFVCLHSSLFKNSASRACSPSTKLLTLGMRPWKPKFLIILSVVFLYTIVENRCLGPAGEVQAARREGLYVRFIYRGDVLVSP